MPGLKLHLMPRGPNHRAGKDHAFRLVSWNVRGTYAPYDYLYVALSTKADILVIQEPYCPDPTDSFANWLQTEALRRGYDLYVSKHTLIYVCKNHLGRRALEHKSTSQGRAQTLLLAFDNPNSETDTDTTYVVIVGAYGYQSGTVTDPDTNPGPRDLQEAVSDCLGTYQRQYPHRISTFIIGDLQNTIDNSPTHNRGRSRPRTDYNLLCLAEQLDLTSVIPTKHPDLPYHTRSGAGLDHIMAPSHLEVTAAGINTTYVDQLLNSDHHLIFADVIFGAPSPPTPRPALIEEIQWRRVTNIPCYRPAPQEDEWWSPDNRSGTRANHKHMDLYAKLQQASRDPHVTEHLKEAKYQLQRAKSLMKTIYKEFDATDHDPAECPEWTPDLADAIDECHNNLMQGQISMMHLLDLVTITNPDKARINYLKKFELSYSQISKEDTAFPAFQRIQALTNAAVAQCSNASTLLPPPPAPLATDLVDTDDEDVCPTEPPCPPPPPSTIRSAADSTTRLLDHLSLLSAAAADFDADRTDTFFEQQDAMQQRDARLRQLQHRAPIQPSRILADVRAKSCEIAARVSGGTTHWEQGTGRRTAPPTKHHDKYRSIEDLLSPWTTTPEDAPPDTARSLPPKSDETAWMKITADPEFRRRLKTILNRLRRYKVALRQSRASACRGDENYLAHTNQLGDLCRRFSRKPTSLPQLQSALITPSANRNPQLTHVFTIQGQIDATTRMQERQMQAPAGTPAPFGCDYVNGPHGDPINFTYNNKHFTEEDLPAYCGDRLAQCSPTDRQHIIDAHHKYEHEFREPASHNPHLIWPFTYDLATDTMVASSECDQLIHRIGGHPGKMRHNGYSIHFLARLEDEEWFRITVELMAIIITVRYQPRASRDSTRALIPKPGSRTDRRPICLATDISAILSAVVQAFFSSSIDRAEVLPDWARAYRKGISVDECTILLLCAIEDNCQYGLQRGALLAIIDEDFEKYYDTISSLFQAHCLRQMGCPHHGYIEWLFSDLGPNTVAIKTVDHIIYSTFTNGLKQGKGFSCPTATSVAAYVVSLWLKNTPQDPSLTYGNDRPDLGYTLHSKHPADADFPVSVANSFCDDNTRILGVRYNPTADDQRLTRWMAAEEALADAALKQLICGGELTTLTKMSRKAIKCLAALLGLPPRHAASIDALHAHAWNYNQQRPQLDPIKTIRQTSHLATTTCPSPPDREYFRSFGAYINLMAEVQPRNLDGFRLKITQCFQRGRSRSAAVILFNTMVASHFQFNALILGGSIVDACIKVDMVIIRDFAKFFGLTERDPKHKIFLKPASMGYGLRSIAASLLLAFLREQEVLLNKIGRPFDSLRGRLVAIMDDRLAQNFMHTSIKAVSAYGFFPRNGHEPLHTMIMLELSFASSSHQPPLGTKLYRLGERPPPTATHLSSALIGRGSPTHGHRFCLYGPIDTYVRLNSPPHDPILRSDGEQPQMATFNYWRHRPTHCSNATPASIATACRRAIHRLRSEQEAEISALEWRAALGDSNPLTSNRWSLLTFPPNLEPLTPDDLNGRVPEYIESIRLNPSSLDRNPPHVVHPDTRRPASLAASDSQVYDKIFHYESFPILASDSGRVVINDMAYIVTSAVLCTIDLRNVDIANPDEWESLPTIPLLARVKVLPESLGTTTVTNNVGELFGILMMDGILPTDTPALQFTDSLTNQAPAIKLRDHRDDLSHRSLIRDTLTSPSRALMYRLDHTMQRINDTTQWHPPELRDRLEAVATAAKEWPGRKNDIIKNPVPKAAIDTHTRRPLMHVYSHQMRDDGTLKSPTGSSAQQAIPCFVATSANFWADRLCTISQQSIRRPLSSPPTAGPPATATMRYPGITMPYTPSTIVNIFHDNTMIDTTASDYAADCWQTQLQIDYSTKPRHGWLDRYQGHITNTDHLGIRQALHALGHGRGKCHCRDAYIDAHYRLATFYQRYGSEADPPDDLHAFTDPILRRCPFCPNDPRAPTGDTIHLHCSCTHPDITEIRDAANQAIHRTLQAFDLLRQHSPEPTPCIITAIGEAMRREDRTPAIHPTGRADTFRHLRTSIRTDMQDIDAWLADEATRHNTTSLPHPTQRIRATAPCAIRAGLIPCRAERSTHAFDTATDMMFLGVLPAAIDGDVSAALQQFRSATKLTWEQLDEHYHSLSDTNRFLAALMPLGPVTLTDPEGEQARPKVKATLNRIWTETKLALVERTTAIQRVAGTLQSIHARQTKKTYLHDLHSDLIECPANSDDEDEFEPITPVSQVPSPTRPDIRYLCTGPGCTIANAQDDPGRTHTYPSQKSNMMCSNCGHVQAAQFLCEKLELAAQKSSTIRLETAQYRSTNPHTHPAHIHAFLIKTTSLNTVITRQGCGVRTIKTAAQLFAKTVLITMAARNQYWWDPAAPEHVATAATALCHCAPAARLPSEPHTPIFCQACKKLNHHPAQRSLAACRSCNMTSTMTVCNACQIFALLHINSHHNRLATIGVQPEDLAPRPPPPRPSIVNPYAHPVRIGRHRTAPQRRSPSHQPRPELNVGSLFRTSPATEDRIKALWHAAQLPTSQVRRPSSPEPPADPRPNATADDLPESQPLRTDTADIPHQYVPRTTITYDDFALLKPGGWLNDVLLNTIGQLLCQQAPYSRVRRWWLTGHVDTLRRDPQHRSVAQSLRRRRATRRDRSDRPTLLDPLILTPWNCGLLKTLLVRERSPNGSIQIYIMDSLQDEDTVEEIRTTLTGSVLVPEEWDGSILSLTGFSQPAGCDSGVNALLHAYFWIYHNDGLHPKDINWHQFELAIPNLVPRFRLYLAAILTTGTVENMFQGTLLHTINNPNPPTDPTRTNQHAITDFFTPPAADDEEEEPPTPPSTTKRKRGRHAKRRRLDQRHRHDSKKPATPDT